MEKKEYHVQFLKNGRILDTMDGQGKSKKELEKILPEMKQVSWSAEVNKAENIQYRIIEVVKEGVL